MKSRNYENKKVSAAGLKILDKYENEFLFMTIKKEGLLIDSS